MMGIDYRIYDDYHKLSKRKVLEMLESHLPKNLENKQKK